MFFKSKPKNLANTKKSESLENCTTLDAGILNAHFQRNGPVYWYLSPKKF